MNHQGEVAYEIDKRQGRYTNVCVSHGSDSQGDDDVDRLATELAQKAMVAAQREETYASIDKDSKEEVTKDPGYGIEKFKQKRILTPISDCAIRDVKAVQKYLDSSSEAQLFVRGRHSDGQTTLIIAARGQSPAMVSLLIKHGADVNAVDNNGRTALMEAALFGWVDNVKVLLKHNADKTIRDGENRLAIELARDHYKNREERYVRAGGDLTSSSNRRPAYVEDTFRRDIDRNEIVILLGGEKQKSNIAFGRPPTLSLSKYSFKRSQDSFVLYGPIEEYPITSKRKTVARLERGGSFLSVGAMSGWSHCSAQELRVDGRQWTDDVFYISEVVDHRLPSDGKDQGKDGQYNACHAEKQLIAYFIDRHVFLPRDGLPCSELEEKIKLKEDEIQEISLRTEIGRRVTSLRNRKEDLKEEFLDWDEKLVGKYDEIRALELKLDSAKSALNRLIGSPEARPFLELESQLDVLNQQQRRHNDLIKMANAPLPVSLTEAVILVSSPPCRDCKMFKDKVNKFFGLSIQLFAAH
ncbi:hypothetical protein E8E15_009743 [Penicillium rubens]|uniref:uncharacterized protein n=1 Tax=Penicillium rubens TaxID=1108849 RepID=UPI001D87F870|nr:uncharacterized protein N7525_007033 [Penicillium rubens]KAF3028194.1 hypothetical protein E8E15_009743 [Penicillium rubens]KAJ5049563.1 hypothetical protein NUH16_008082 [Penicillium rubens]KAJ5828780.1 hypothetical protein N7525_007033 [Penicillium rubens]KAJ5841519.1 hypothetical protein N7534_011349 [Penicillium rubens]